MVSDEVIVGFDYGRATLSLVGGKGANLARLTQAGFPVPPGFCVTTAAYGEHLAAGLQPQVDEILATIDYTGPMFSAQCAVAVTWPDGERGYGNLERTYRRSQLKGLK